MNFDLMRTCARAALLACCGAVAAGAAVAGAGTLTTTVTPLTPEVTYSRPASTSPEQSKLDTFVGYTVSIVNNGGNTINRIRFTAKTAVTDVDEKALFSSIEGASCTVGGGGTTLDCAIGQLKAGQAWPTFAVFFKAPIKDAASPLPDGVAGEAGKCIATTDCVAFSGITYYAETLGGQNSPVDNSVAEWAAADVPLGTFNPVLVKSAVQKSGGTLFTGNGGVPAGADLFATKVIVPAGLAYTTAVISESPDASGCGNHLSTCFRSDITVPGSFSPYLTIVLRQDASTILKGTKIDSVLIEYTGSGAPVLVGDCASPTTPRSDDLPCIAKRTSYKSSRTPGWTPQLDGDFEWWLINRKNGSYKVF